MTNDEAKWNFIKSNCVVLERKNEEYIMKTFEKLSKVFKNPFIELRFPAHRNLLKESIFSSFESERCFLLFCFQWKTFIIFTWLSWTVEYHILFDAMTAFFTAILVIWYFSLTFFSSCCSPLRCLVTLCGTFKISLAGWERERESDSIALMRNDANEKK